MFASRTKPTEMELLFHALGSKDPDRRYHALMDARELAAEQLTELVKASRQREKRSSWRNNTRMGIIFAMASGSMFSFPVGFYLICVLVCLFIALSDYDHPRGERYDERLLREVESDAYRNVSLRAANNWYDENLIRVMERAPDSRCVEAVLWMLGTAQGTARARLLTVLQHRLPELRAGDVREWTARQKEPLQLLLGSWHQNDALAYCILKAMPEIGGAWALESVELLAKLQQWQPEQITAIYIRHRMQELPWQGRRQADLKPTRREIDETIESFRRIGEAAAECLPGLQEKVMDGEAAKVLLRAAGVENQTQELLRPAGDRGAVTDPATLLRPGMRTSHSPEERASVNRQ